MHRMKSKKFERILKEKYGIEWKGGHKAYHFKDSLYPVREAELIGIMVIELMEKGACIYKVNFPSGI